MLAHRLRRWANIKTTLGQRLLFAGMYREDIPTTFLQNVVVKAMICDKDRAYAIFVLYLNPASRHVDDCMNTHQVICHSHPLPPPLTCLSSGLLLHLFF